LKKLGQALTESAYSSAYMGAKKQKANPEGLAKCWNSGAGERSRTLDLLITSELLYQLSYTGNFRAWALKG
jgi:hypothetical protein